MPHSQSYNLQPLKTSGTEGARATFNDETIYSRVRQTGQVTSVGAKTKEIKKARRQRRDAEVASELYVLKHDILRCLSC